MAIVYGPPNPILTIKAPILIRARTSHMLSLGFCVPGFVLWGIDLGISTFDSTAVLTLAPPLLMLNSEIQRKAGPRVASARSTTEKQPLKNPLIQGFDPCSDEKSDARTGQILGGASPMKAAQYQIAGSLKA